MPDCHIFATVWRVLSPTLTRFDVGKGLVGGVAKTAVSINVPEPTLLDAFDDADARAGITQVLQFLSVCDPHFPR